MPRKMSLAREIRIQKLQDKNRMVGQTFNPSGFTSGQLNERERNFVLEMKSKGIEYRINWWKEREEVREQWKGSWPWEWSTFERNFVSQNSVL